jgi:hypothetical protein
LNDRKMDASIDENDLPFWIPKLWIDTLKLRKEWTYSKKQEWR